MSRARRVAAGSPGSSASGRRRAAPAALLAVATLVACAGPAPTPGPTSPVPPTPTAAPVAWRDCAFGRCTEVAVPLDPARPDGATITLAVAMRPASGPRRGAIFVHPGGPGVSGRERLASIDRTGLEGYDLIAWDARGVGGSEPLACLDGAAADAFLARDVTLADADAATATWDAARSDAAAFAAACRAARPALVDHLDAATQAHDLEALRVRLTGEPLRYLGISAGGLVGAAYADHHGEQVAAMVLDSPPDPAAPAAAQLAGFEAALARAGLTDATADVLARVHAAPLAVGARTLTRPLAASGVLRLLYSGDPAPLSAALAAAQAGDGAPLLAAADALTGRGADGRYGGLLGAFRATNCADTPWRDEAAALASWRAGAAAAPTLGEALGPDLVCVGFPAAAPPVEARGADVGVPIVVLASTGDPATPYAGAQRLAAGLKTGVLITRAGEGHGALRRGAACVDAAATAALTAGDAGFDVTAQRC